MSYETVLEYNGVRLRNCQTLDFEDTPIFDSSGQNLKFLKKRIRVLGYFSRKVISGFGIDPNLVNGASAQYPELQPGAGQQYFMLHSYLNEPRKELKYYTTTDPFGGPTGGTVQGGDSAFVVFEASPAPVDVFEDLTPKMDAKGGPFPKMVKITHISGNEVWRVEFEIESCVIPPCNPISGFNRDTSPNPDENLESLFPDGISDTFDNDYQKFGILNHRWSCIDSMDDNRYLTRSYTGRVDLANPNWNPHDYRVITVPPLTPGMRREIMEYRASEDGLQLSYHVVDKEVTITAPPGATSVFINHKESIQDLGAIVHVFFQVRVQGERLQRKENLVRIAHAIAEGKLNLFQSMGGNGHHPILRPIRLELDANEGTDQNNEVTFLFVGIRESLDNGLLLNKELPAAFFARLKSVPGTALDNYNNQRSHGNRAGEVPDADFPIPSLAALHSVMTARCDYAVTMEDAAQFSEIEFQDRTIRTEAMRPSGFNVNDIYEPFYPQVLVEIDESENPAAHNPSYSFAHSQSVYTTYRITTTYDAPTLSVQLPYSGPAPSGSPGETGSDSSKIVRVGPTQHRKIIQIEAERYGSVPRMPNPSPQFTEPSLDGGITTNVLISCRPQGNSPVISPSGQGRLYTIRLECVYAMTRQPRDMRLGVPEYEEASTATPDSTTLLDFSFPFATLFSGNWSFDA